MTSVLLAQCWGFISRELVKVPSGYCWVVTRVFWVVAKWLVGCFGSLVQ